MPNTSPSAQPDDHTGSSDLLVIGAGVAGGLAAVVAAKLGLRVTLVDRATWPRDKVCGACLNTRALDAYKQAGIASLVASLADNPIKTMRLRVGRSHATLRLPEMLAIDRKTLDAAVVSHAVTAGVRFLPRTRASVCCDLEGQQRITRLSRESGEEVNHRSPWVLITDGLSGGALRGVPGFESSVKPRSRVGLGAVIRVDDGANSGILEPGVIHMTVSPEQPGGYVGVVGLKGGLIDIAACVDAAFIKKAGGPRRALAQLLTGCTDNNPAAEYLGETLLTDERICVRGTPPLTRRRQQLAAPGILVAGDAAGYIEPFTGEGMAWAATSGVRAAQFVAKELRCPSVSSADASNAWERSVHQLVRQRQRACRASAFVLRHPLLASGLCAAAAPLAPISGAILRSINTPATSTVFSVPSKGPAA